LYIAFKRFRVASMTTRHKEENKNNYKLYLSKSQTLKY
jgi:hypothetical protein